MDTIFVSGEAEDLIGLPPIVSPSARVLVLGTMPGPRALELREYYAGPGNRFWRLTADLLGVDLGSSYGARVAQLQQSGVAVWDVFRECRRIGALDSNIEKGSEVPNNLGALLEVAPEIKTIALNGKTAAAAFRRLSAVPPLVARGVRVLDLPSTSAANARCRYEVLREKWSVALAPNGRKSDFG